jgi:primosomal protein N' (replication factor Y)
MDFGMLNLAQNDRNDRRETAHWVEVLVDCPGAEGLYTYQVPLDLKVQPGDIVNVPFGTQQVGGIAVQLLSSPPDLAGSPLKAVEAIVSAGFFPPTYWELLNRVARYYHTSLMQVVKMALPPGVLAKSQRRVKLRHDKPEVAHLAGAAQQILQVLAGGGKDYSWQFIQRQVQGASRGLQELLKLGLVESYLEPPSPVKPKARQAVTLVGVDGATSDRQRQILEILRREGGEMWLTDLLQSGRTTTPTLKKMEQQGCLVVQPREVLRAEQSPKMQRDRPKDLTPAQAEVLAVLHQVTEFQPILLHGVTGSGKTEVYLQAIAPLIQQGKSALVLVPEIGLTPQLTDRFQSRFGEQVRVYHSALSEGERFDTWRQMLIGTSQIVIGTRSAIFAPLPNLGIIILDEEHDSSFKQDQPAPCYHARTVARWRAELENCPLILGSATPSLESWVAAQQPQASYLSLPQRVMDRPMPRLEVVDMRQELRDGNKSIFSRSLSDALRQLKTNQRQGVLFIHRRGHSTFVSCRNCGYVMECPNCDVSLSFHQPHENAKPLLRCHYCNHGESQPAHCPACGSNYFKQFGSGTQRVMQALAQEFPELKAIRFDSDTTRAKGAHRALLTQFGQGDADLLVGTQMLTKGIDLPQVTLVGVISADGLLNLADFRASERAFQTLTQVAGRAGRGTEPGRVVIQTYTPEHPVIQAVQQQGYESFVNAELAQRQMMQYPPYGSLVLLRLSGLTAAAVQAAAEHLAQILQQHPDYDVLGPAPAAILRIAQRYRWQILLKAQQPFTIANLEALRSRCGAGISLTIDVDPLHLS